MTDTNIGLTGIAALEAEMRDRLAAKDKYIAELERERDEARAIVASANNSVFGSWGYFTDAGGKTLKEAIEHLNDLNRNQTAVLGCLCDALQKAQGDFFDIADEAKFIARGAESGVTPKTIADALKSLDGYAQDCAEVAGLALLPSNISNQCNRIAELEADLKKARSALEGAAGDVFAERRRQIEVEGWTPEHDDAHTRSEMALAAACYAIPPSERTAPLLFGQVGIRKRLWPWLISWWKPKSRRQDLVRAGALILAEIERIDRAALAGQKERER